MLDLNKLFDEKELKAKVGDELRFSLHIQESVGYVPELVEHDKDILELKEKKITRVNEGKMENLPSGSDEGECTFIMKAIKAGKTELLFHQTFRGDKKEEFKFVIKVV